MITQAEEENRNSNITRVEQEPRDKVESGNDLHSVDPAEEKRVVRKMDRHVIPMLLALYLLSFLDRSNIGNAEIAGMATDLHLSSGDYQWLLTIFYISYILFEFQILMWKAFPPHAWAAFAVFGWGIVSSLQAATVNWQGMMACRFFLGAMEAAYGPGVPYYLSFFYLRRELGFRIGLFLSAAPLASCFAGALAYGITSGHPGIAPWRVLFLVEGLPTIVMAGVAYFYLPDSPAKAKFLTADEKAVCHQRSVRQVGDQVEFRIGHVHMKEIIATVLDLKNLLPALMYFSTNIGFSSLPVYLPTILKELGFTAIHAQGLSAPPYFVSFLVVILSGYIGDKYQQRGFVLVASSLTGAVGYIILATTTSVGGRYFAVYLTAMGVFPSIIMVLPWIINNQGSDTKRGMGVVILNLIGQCSPLLGTRLYPANESPYYRKGQWVCAAFLLFNVLLALTYRFVLARENKALDKKYGPIKEDVAAGEENDGPNFRYIL